MKRKTVAREQLFSSEQEKKLKIIICKKIIGTLQHLVITAELKNYARFSDNSDDIEKKILITTQNKKNLTLFFRIKKFFCAKKK